MNKAKVAELKTILTTREFSRTAKIMARRALKRARMDELLEVEKVMIMEGKDGFDSEANTREYQILDNLPKEHPIYSLVADHDELLVALEDLNKVNQEMLRTGVTKASLGKLKKIANILERSERHQRKEEKVLFAELENRGIGGTTEILRAEHIGFREHRKELSTLLENPKAYFNFRSEVDRITRYLSCHMKEHIFKENNILYPAALGAIADINVWIRIKEKLQQHDKDKI